MSQLHREAAGRRIATGANIAEDLSKSACSDVVITYNQTDAEKQLGLARLYVAKARMEEDRFIILVSQNYALGQFCLGSTRMRAKQYDDLLRGADGGNS